MTTNATPFDPASVLPDTLLDRFRERAAQHDSDNTFPHDDLADLTDAGYLALFAPTELGGPGTCGGVAVAAATGHRSTGDGARDQHAPGLDRRGEGARRPGSR